MLLKHVSELCGTNPIGYRTAAENIVEEQIAMDTSEAQFISAFLCRTIPKRHASVNSICVQNPSHIMNGVYVSTFVKQDEDLSSDRDDQYWL